MSSNFGTLWVVATPIGNPGDLSLRARETLSAVHGIFAEDTRKTGLLLSRSGLGSKDLISLHEHNEDERIALALERLREGQHLALVSDAGTPLLSDPGFRLVRACREAGMAVSPVPGPSAPLAALSASGLPPYPFAFLGFAPRKEGERKEFFAPYASLALTLVFFERKDRLHSTLGCALDVLGPREGCLAREITKTHEEFIRFALEDCEKLPRDLRGEITVLLGPPKAPARAKDSEVDAVIGEEMAAGGKPRELAHRVQARVSGWSAKDLYQRIRSLAVKDD